MDYTFSFKMGESSFPIMGFLLLCFLISFLEAGYIIYEGPKVPLNRRIKDLISLMTLEEKIGQMTQIERNVATPETMKKYFIDAVHGHNNVYNATIFPHNVVVGLTRNTLSILMLLYHMRMELVLKVLRCNGSYLLIFANL